MRLYNIVPLICCILPVEWVNCQMSVSYESDDTSFCCNAKPGPQVQTASTTLAEVLPTVANDSPYYGTLVTNSYYTEGIDNLCITYYPCGDGAYVMFTSITYNDTSFTIERFLISELKSYVGVSRITGLAQRSGSSTIIYDEVFLGSPCSGLRVYYRNYIAGSCDVLEYATLDDIHFVHADSSCRYVSHYCKSQVADIATSQFLKETNFDSLPNRLNCNCVTQWNGVSCINADKVQPQDTNSLPDTESSCYA